MNKEIYTSKIDWWIWAVLVFFFTVLIVAGIGGMGWVTFWIYLIGFGAIFFVSHFGIWYAIEGDNLIVYQFCRPKRFPIKKIKEVGCSKSILSAPALSTKRLAIKFTDRSVLKSSMPIEISPKDRDGFIYRLLEINPEIKVIR